VKAFEMGTVVLEGVLLPGSWGTAGEILGVSLMTFDEEEYRIDPASADRLGLRDLLRRHVRLAAVPRDGRLIQVTRVELLEGMGRTPG
jgi:hypothetical protein